MIFPNCVGSFSKILNLFKVSIYSIYKIFKNAVLKLKIPRKLCTMNVPLLKERINSSYKNISWPNVEKEKILFSIKQLPTMFPKCICSFPKNFNLFKVSVFSIYKVFKNAFLKLKISQELCVMYVPCHKGRTNSFSQEY